MSTLINRRIRIHNATISGGGEGYRHMFDANFRVFTGILIYFILDQVQNLPVTTLIGTTSVCVSKFEIY